MVEFTSRNLDLYRTAHHTNIGRMNNIYMCGELEVGSFFWVRYILLVVRLTCQCGCWCAPSELCKGCHRRWVSLHSA